MTREQASTLGIFLAMGGVFGGWLVTLANFSDALTPQAIGGLLIALSTAYGGGKMMQSFDSVRSMPRENPPPAVTENTQVNRRETPDKIIETVQSSKTTEIPKVGS